jgi:glycosyltransferase involved in cell wall biosynthesis
VPVYNEARSFQAIIERIRDVPLGDIERELVIVDDGSTDGTAQLVDRERERGARVVHHPRNRGKGAAIRTGFEHATGDVLVIQDADLEYDPADFVRLLAPIRAGEAHVVYGSRFLGERRGMTVLGFLANRSLSVLTSLFYGTRITDMETCYKMLRRQVIEGMVLRAEGFDIEPELTSKILRGGWRILEVPIRYEARSQAEGKKIGWRDGVQAIWTLVRFRLAR